MRDGAATAIYAASACSWDTGDVALNRPALQGLGTMLGPAIGGITATPCQTYGDSFPLCSEGALFQHKCAGPLL